MDDANALQEDPDPALPTTWKELGELARNTMENGEPKGLGVLEGNETGQPVGSGFVDGGLVVPDVASDEEKLFAMTECPLLQAVQSEAASTRVPHTIKSPKDLIGALSKTTRLNL